MRTRLGTHFAIALFVLCLSYGVFQARDLIRGPVLVVETPTPGMTIEGDILSVRGTVRNVSAVLLNGQPITTNTEGDFAQTLLTPPGYGAILVSAEDRFGRTVEEHIPLYGAPVRTQADLGRETALERN